jgi:hypothetical protein
MNFGNRGETEKQNASMHYLLVAGISRYQKKEKN